jgi:hypothetical protein
VVGWWALGWWGRVVCSCRGWGSVRVFGGWAMVPVVTGARLGVLEALSARLDGVARDVRAGSGPLEGGGSQASVGAGQFTGALEGGVGDFLVSWAGVLGACSRAGELISDGVGDFVAGLRGVDRRASRAMIVL